MQTTFATILETKTNTLFAFDSLKRTFYPNEVTPLVLKGQFPIFAICVKKDKISLEFDSVQNFELTSQCKVFEVAIAKENPDYILTDGDHVTSLGIRETLPSTFVNRVVEFSLQFTSKKDPKSPIRFLLIKVTNPQYPGWSYNILTPPLIVLSNTSQFLGVTQHILDSIIFNSSSTLHWHNEEFVDDSECKEIMQNLLSNNLVKSRTIHKLTKSDFEFLLEKAGFSENAYVIPKSTFQTFWVEYFAKAFETIRKANIDITGFIGLKTAEEIIRNRSESRCCVLRIGSQPNTLVATYMDNGNFKHFLFPETGISNIDLKSYGFDHCILQVDGRHTAIPVPSRETPKENIRQYITQRNLFFEFTNENGYSNKRRMESQNSSPNSSPGYSPGGSSPPFTPPNHHYQHLSGLTTSKVKVHYSRPDGFPSTVEVHFDSNSTLQDVLEESIPDAIQVTDRWTATLYDSVFNTKSSIGSAQLKSNASQMLNSYDIIVEPITELILHKRRDSNRHKVLLL